jgi:hypothetical protein
MLGVLDQDLEEAASAGRVQVQQPGFQVVSQLVLLLARQTRERLPR